MRTSLLSDTTASSGESAVALSLALLSEGCGAGLLLSGGCPDKGKADRPRFPPLAGAEDHRDDDQVLPPLCRISRVTPFTARRDVTLLSGSTWSRCRCRNTWQRMGRVPFGGHAWTC